MNPLVALLLRAFGYRSSPTLRHSANRGWRRRLLLEPLETRTTPATFLVTTTADAGTGSLRQAIFDANAAATDDAITFDTAGVFATSLSISLITVLPQITAAGGALTITGTGASNLTVKRDPPTFGSSTRCPRS